MSELAALHIEPEHSTGSVLSVTEALLPHHMAAVDEASGGFVGGGGFMGGGDRGGGPMSTSTSSHLPDMRATTPRHLGVSGAGGIIAGAGGGGAGGRSAGTTTGAAPYIPFCSGPARARVWKKPLN